MKILYVLDTYYPKVDGPATVINNIARILTENKLAEVDLLVPRYPKYKDTFVYKVIRCTSIFGPDNYRTGVPILTRNLKKTLTQGNYDLIHIHSPFTVGKYAINFAKKHNIPSINTIHTRYKSDFERKLKGFSFLQNFMMRYISNVLNNSDYVLTVSNGFAKELNSDVYKCKKKVNVIRNATEFSDNTDLSNEIKDLEIKHNLDNEFRLLFVGRLVENKNIQFSLRVLKELKDKCITNFKFIIVGEGNYKAELEKLVDKYNIKENVIFTGLINDRKQLSAYYKMSDLFLFPSTFDTCGIVALEAGSFGLPSIMLSGSYASELIENGKNGFIACDDYDDWANIIKNCISQKDKIKSMKNYTKKSLNKSWEEITIEYYNFYKIVLLQHKLKSTLDKGEILCHKNTPKLKPLISAGGGYTTLLEDNFHTFSHLSITARQVA